MEGPGGSLFKWSLIKESQLARQGPAGPPQGPSQAGSLALYDPPPVVTPGKQPSPGGGQDQVLIVAAGEQDVLPAWGLFQAWGSKDSV